MTCDLHSRSRRDRWKDVVMFHSPQMGVCTKIEPWRWERVENWWADNFPKSNYFNRAVNLSISLTTSKDPFQNVQLTSSQWREVFFRETQLYLFLAALAALYLPVVSDRHFSISTQKITFLPWDPSDILSEWQKDKKTKRQN